MRGAIPAASSSGYFRNGSSLCKNAWYFVRVTGLRVWMIYRGGISGLPICLAHVGPWAGFCRFERRSGWIEAQIEADGRLCRPHGRDQRAAAHDVHDALEIVGQHVQGHFGADPFQRLHLEVG